MYQLVNPLFQSLENHVRKIKKHSASNHKLMNAECQMLTGQSRKLSQPLPQPNFSKNLQIVSIPR